MMSLVGAESTDFKLLREKVCQFLQRTNDPQAATDANTTMTSAGRPLISNGADQTQTKLEHSSMMSHSSQSSRKNVKNTMNTENLW